MQLQLHTKTSFYPVMKLQYMSVHVHQLATLSKQNLFLQGIDGTDLKRISYSFKEIATDTSGVNHWAFVNNLLQELAQ